MKNIHNNLKLIVLIAVSSFAINSHAANNCYGNKFIVENQAELDNVSFENMSKSVGWQNETSAPSNQMKLMDVYSVTPDIDGNINVSFRKDGAEHTMRFYTTFKSGLFQCSMQTKESLGIPDYLKICISKGQDSDSKEYLKYTIISLSGKCP